MIPIKRQVLLELKGKLTNLSNKEENHEKKYSTANSFNSRCDQCLEKKISIINFKGTRLLNK